MTTIDEASPTWDKATQALAHREGWFIWSTQCSECGPWQISKIDDPEDFQEGLGLSFTPPTLESDDDAWRIVLQGTGPHHAYAREFIKVHNPLEMQSMLALQGKTS